MSFRRAAEEQGLESCCEAARHDLHLALARLPVTLFPPDTWPDQAPGQLVTCLRSVLMKHEHLQWLDDIWSRLSAAALP